MPIGKRKKLFVAMPFKSKYDSIFETVRRAAENLDLELVQIGETAFTGSIVDRVRSGIEEADCMIAIATEENGMYIMKSDSRIVSENRCFCLHPIRNKPSSTCGIIAR